ncbi:MAG: signal peptidase II [Desulfuromonadaceae bacterium]
MRHLMFFVIALLLVLIDQATKFYIDQSMLLYASIPVIDSFFSITYVRNPGAAFGMFAGSGFRIPFLIGVSMLAMVVIVFVVHKLPGKEKTPVIALSCIFAGACGNLIDRIRFGEVIDFLDVYWRNHHWPTFNIADSAICLGVVLYVLYTMKEERQRSLAEPA